MPIKMVNTKGEIEGEILGETPDERHGADMPEILPLPNDYPHVWALVVQDMLKRKQFGKKKYGMDLQPFNGRDALYDAYQEALDLVVYLRQAIFERDHSKEEKINNEESIDSLQNALLVINKLQTDPQEQLIFYRETSSKLKFLGHDFLASIFDNIANHRQKILRKKI